MRGKQKRVLSTILTLALTLSLLPAMPHTAGAATTNDVLDLANPPTTGGRYNVNTTDHVITVYGTDPVKITGDGTNDGDGWSIIISAATYIELDAGTVIYGALSQPAALRVPDGAVIKGLGNDPTDAPSITAQVTNSSINACIYADGSVTISGTVGDITGTYGIYAPNSGSDVTISGTVGDITTEQYGIRASIDLTISGTVGEITTEYYGIYAYSGDIEISGTVGNIESTNNSGIHAYSGDVTISGAVGDITAKEHGIYAANSVNVTISGEVGAITAYYNGIYASSGDVTPVKSVLSPLIIAALEPAAATSRYPAQSATSPQRSTAFTPPTASTSQYPAQSVTLKARIIAAFTPTPATSR